MTRPFRSVLPVGGWLALALVALHPTPAAAQVFGDPPDSSVCRGPDAHLCSEGPLVDAADRVGEELGKLSDTACDSISTADLCVVKLLRDTLCKIDGRPVAKAACAPTSPSGPEGADPQPAPEPAPAPAPAPAPEGEPSESSGGAGVIVRGGGINASVRKYVGSVQNGTVLTNVDLGGSPWRVKMVGKYELDRTRVSEYHAVLEASRSDGTKVTLLLGGDGTTVYAIEPQRAKRIVRR